MKVLILAPVWPEPTSSAGGRRMMDLIQLFLEQNWSLHFGTSAAPTEQKVNLLELGIQEHSIKVNSDCFDELVRKIQPDLVLFDRFYTEEQFGWRVELACPEALRVIETCDLHSLRETRRKLIAKEKQYRDFSSSELREGMLLEDKTVREIAAIFRSDLTLMISEFETQFLIEQFQVPSDLLHTLGFMTEETSKQVLGFNERKDFVTIGNFQHEPNWDSVLWLQQKIWPSIRSALPDAQLKIYGSYAPEKALALHNPSKGFHVLGRAQDAETVLSQARVCLSPLRFGAGLKGKLFDAMKVGTPSVTTPIGTEGTIFPTEAWCGVVSSTEQGLIEGSIKLYQDQSYWETSQTHATVIRNRFSKLKLAPPLVQRLTHLRNDKTALRSFNFMGKMLRHHSLHSTRHLSNWIHLKNQMK